ncbi:MAG: DUF3592 domain-containing protein [Leptolinea sp.]|nr:DUF3592 domain-containing protein [Leptolinea sp.]
MVHINFGTFIPLFLAILSGGLGCAFLVLSWQRKRKETITSQWLPTQGIILSSELKEYRASGTTSNGESTFAPLVRYQYTCNGRTYGGIRITFSSVNYSRGKAEQISNRYSPGDAITVYYDPLHPEEAVLEKETNITNSLRMTGLVLLTLGFGSLCITALVFLAEKTFQ